MLAMPSSEAAYRPHRFPATSPWSNSMTDYPEIHQYTYPARPLPPDHKARPHPDVFQNGIQRHSQENTSHGLSFHAGSRAFIDHDDLLAPQRADALSNSSSPPSDTSERAQQLLEAHSVASSSAQSSDPGASSPSTSAGASDFASRDSSYTPKSLLGEALDADPDATPIRSKSTTEAPGLNGAAPESGHRHQNSLSSPLSPLVEPFNPHTGSTPMPALSVYNAPPGAADLQHQRSSTSLASLASGTSEPRAPGFESRSPSTTGSVSSGVTVHSLYAPQYNETNVNGLLADLGSPNSLTQAAFASLGAQLATQERGANIPSSKSQDAGSSTSEEISTIFVVGFPEDMQEREFQNMFIFSPGFEAATLKTPEASSSTSSSSRDGAGKYNSAMDGFNMPFGNYNDDGYGGLNPRPLPSTLDREKDAANAQRRQTIGFAKFRTRQEAVDAVAVLSGRRVDAEKDCVLKAEMAKKNLHTKRGLANEYSNPSSSTVGVGNAAGNNSLPHSVLALGQHNLAVAAALSPQVIATALAQQQVQRDPTALAALMRDQDHRDQRDVRSHQQQSAAFDAFHSVPPPSSSPTYPRGSVDAGSAVAQADPRYNAYGSREHRESITSNSSSAPYFRPGSASRETNNFGKSLLQQLDTETPFASSSPSSAIGQTSDGYTRHAFYSSAGLDEPTSQSYTGLGSVHAASNLNSRIQGLSLNTGLAPRERPTSPLSGGLTSPRGTNPADMNPPINTLYVGGLPAVLPSLTGPMSASHLEDSLRAVFSRSPGFKRLCFRQKSNGPMSFVEYENVELATRALHDLYGHTLGGLVKGGIRLSYSKNPLGVRSGSVSTPTSSHTPLSPSSNNFSTFLGGSDPYLTNNTPTPNANISRRLGHDAPLNGYQQTYRAHTPRSATSPPPVSPGQTSTFSPFGEMSRGIF